MERKFYKIFNLKPVLVLLFVFTGIQAFCTDHKWTNAGGDRLWSNASNWDVNTIPGINDYVEITDIGDTVFMDMNDTIHELYMNGNSVLEFLNSGELNVGYVINFETMNSYSPVVDLNTGTFHFYGGGGDRGIINCNKGNLITEYGFGAYWEINTDSSTITLNEVSDLPEIYTYFNLVINSNRCDVRNDFSINGNLSGTGSLYSPWQTIWLRGDMSIKNFYASSTSVIYFMGDRPQHVGNGNYEFVYAGNYNDSGTILNGDITVTGCLIFAPYIYSYSGPSCLYLKGYKLILGDNAYTYMADESNGFIIPEGGTIHALANAYSDLGFPVGTSDSTYTRIILNSASDAYYDVREFNNVIDKNLNAVTRNAVNSTWSVTPESDVTGFTARLQWNGKSEFPSFDRYDMYTYYRTSQSSGTPWIQLGALVSASGGDPYYVFTDAMSLTGDTAYYFSVGDQNSPLPVELVSFTVERLHNENNLHWNTASEINNDHFEIQRSEDAKNWNEIGTMAGHGTTNEKQSYSFIDASVNSLSSKTVYYRLKQVDYNGAFEYSVIRKIITSEKDNSIKVYPNPASDMVFISLSKNEISGTIRIIDMQGKTVYTESINNERQVKIDLAKIRSGMYTLQITSADGVSTHILCKN